MNFHIRNRVVIATNFHDFEKAKTWLLSLNLKGRKPRGIDQKNWSFINHAKDQLKWGDIPATAPTVLRAVNDLTPEMIAVFEGKMGSEATKNNTIKIGSVTFIKEDTSAYARFEEATRELARFFGTLKGYHAIPTKNLTIRFVSKTQVRVKAKYVRDEIWMRFYRGMPKEGDAYGSAKYVLLHELGHRYLKQHRQHWDIDAPEWVTTPYSRKDSIMGGEEKFAELFAISHWPNKYRQYHDKIQKFREKIG